MKDLTDMEFKVGNDHLNAYSEETVARILGVTPVKEEEKRQTFLRWLKKQGSRIAETDKMLDKLEKKINKFSPGEVHDKYISELLKSRELLLKELIRVKDLETNFLATLDALAKLQDEKSDIKAEIVECRLSGSIDSEEYRALQVQLSIMEEAMSLLEIQLKRICK